MQNNHIWGETSQRLFRNDLSLPHHSPGVFKSGLTFPQTAVLGTSLIQS